MFKHPAVSEEIENTWRIEPYRSLHGTDDSDLLVESPADYPIYQGKNIYQYNHDPTFFELESPNLWSFDESTNPEKSGKKRFREKNVRKLKTAIYESLGGEQTSKSQEGFVNDLLGEKRDKPLSEDDVLLDCSEYRLTFRQVTNSTNERTVIASVIPKGVMCLNTLTTVRPFEISPSESDLTESPLHNIYNRIFSERELFVALGLMNSLPFDFLLRTKVDTHIVMYKLKESQMPRLTEGDDWFKYISERAARLSCYGEAFAEMRERLGGINPATDPEERKRLQAEIDAATSHAYGLDREETQFVCDYFHRVQNPRLMTDDYFDLVVKKYDELADHQIDEEQEQ